MWCRVEYLFAAVHSEAHEESNILRNSVGVILYNKILLKFMSLSLPLASRAVEIYPLQLASNRFLSLFPCSPADHICKQSFRAKSPFSKSTVMCRSIKLILGDTNFLQRSLGQHKYKCWFFWWTRDIPTMTILRIFYHQF